MMEGKLIKTEVNYILENDKGVIIASTSLKKKGLSLSLKNCEAIENGYDLDEMAKVNYDCDPYIAEYLEHEFKKGFQKAVEILGDKKFSEKDIERAFIQGVYTKTEIHRKKEDYIQSLQQTEWDVEILMGTHCRQINCVNKGELVKSKIVKDGEVPMLDKDGCLILKRK